MGPLDFVFSLKAGFLTWELPQKLMDLWTENQHMCLWPYIYGLWYL